MKLVPIITLLVVIQITLMIFNGAISETSYDLDPYNTSANIGTGEYLWDFIANPTDWGTTNFLGLWIALGTIGVGAAVITTIGLITRSDMVILAGGATMLFGFGAIPIITLYQFITREVAFFGCTPGAVYCPAAIVVFMLTGGLLGLYYVMAVIEWWTGRQTS